MKKNNIVFVVSSLTEVGGGEKLLFEGVRHYRNNGYNVYIITWKFDKKVLLDGFYDDSNIITLNSDEISRNNITKRGLDRLKSIWDLRKELKKIDPKLILCQGEYDVATLFIATLFTKLQYVFLIFGQNFQFRHDIGKYALIFKKHLKTIIDSQEGYKTTIPYQIPKTSIFNRISNEIISIIRYFAVRKAKKLFVFSKSVQWETKLLFGRTPIINKGAFRLNIFNEIYNIEESKQKFNLPKDKKLLLSFSRLVDKKRIEISINSMKLLDESYHLIIAGKGPEEKNLKDLVTLLDLNQKVTFLGFIEEQDANRLKSCCDIFISLDIGDFDISPFEALALGKIAILPMEIDVDENLATFNNFIVINADYNELAEKIVKISEISYEKKFKEKMSIYSWENYFNTILIS